MVNVLEVMNISCILDAIATQVAFATGFGTTGQV